MNGISVIVICDTGAAETVISWKMYKKLKNGNKELKLYPRQQEWQTASQTPLISKYYTLMEVRRGEIAIQDAMILIGENFGEVILLGRNLLPKLCIDLVKTAISINYSGFVLYQLFHIQYTVLNR
ncbi:hypothetical protein NEIG_02458 [Nematocida sp. ERTm5]|nr:hypothetical protein NEIG_02458 [Nematocida sp. ERTm5]